MSVENIAGAVNLLCLSENEKEKNEIEKEEVIRTKIGEQFRYVFLPVKEMLCYRSFCIKALDVHGIRESEVELELIDMCGTPIETDKFSKVIQKYLHGDAFCVELVIQNVNINVIIISQDLRQYLLNGSDNYEACFVEYQYHNNLSAANLKMLANGIYQFIHGKGIKKDQYESVCRAAVHLFPCVDIEILYDVPNRNGLVYNKMKYAAQKEREKSAKILSLRDSQQDEVNEPAIDEEELKLFFKTCVLGDPEQLEKLREVLRTTISLRDKILADPNVNLIESFPFFYIDQNLIDHDFKLRFPDTDSNALIKLFPHLRTGIFTILNKNNKYIDYLKLYGEGVVEILMVYDHFSTIKSKLQIANFKKLVVFSKDEHGDAVDLIEQHENNSSPYIIAIGSNEKNVKSYYIVVDRQLITIPRDYEFVSVLDLFLKIHFVFKLAYAPENQRLMHLLQHFVYKLNAKTSEISSKMKTLADRLGL